MTGKLSIKAPLYPSLTVSAKETLVIEMAASVTSMTTSHAHSHT
jgi:hypothetical protein